MRKLDGLKRRNKPSLLAHQNQGRAGPGKEDVPHACAPAWGVQEVQRSRVVLDLLVDPAVVVDLCRHPVIGDSLIELTSHGVGL